MCSRVDHLRCSHPYARATRVRRPWVMGHVALATPLMIWRLVGVWRALISPLSLRPLWTLHGWSVDGINAAWHETGSRLPSCTENAHKQLLKHFAGLLTDYRLWVCETKMDRHTEAERRDTSFFFFLFFFFSSGYAAMHVRMTLENFAYLSSYNFLFILFACFVPTIFGLC